MSDTIEATAGYYADSFVAYSPDTTERDRRWFDTHREVANAYVWGRQDAGEGERSCEPSWRFSVVYALACHVTGRTLNLQNSYDEVTATGRLVVDHGRGDALAVQYEMDVTDNSDRAIARHIPSVRYQGFGYRYWTRSNG